MPAWEKRRRTRRRSEDDVDGSKEDVEEGEGESKDHEDKE